MVKHTLHIPKVLSINRKKTEVRTGLVNEWFFVWIYQSHSFTRLCSSWDVVVLHPRAMFPDGQPLVIAEH